MTHLPPITTANAPGTQLGCAALPDSVLIVVPGEAFTITDPSRFTPAATNYMDRFPSLGCPIIHRQNPTRETLRRDGYRGSITLKKYVTKGGLRSECHIQVSIPKLLYGNNLAEAPASAFQALCNTVAAMADAMGVALSADAVARSTVRRIDYGKNIPLRPGMTSFRAIEELHKSNSSDRWRGYLVDYENGGTAVVQATKECRLEVYDKRAELGGAPGSYQRNLAPIDATFPQVIRVEYQLKSPRQIDALLERIGVPHDRSLCALCQPGIARLIVEDAYERWLSTVPAPLPTASFCDLVEQLQFEQPSLTFAEAQAQANYIQVVREKGVRGGRRWLRASGGTKQMIEYRERTLLAKACCAAGAGVLAYIREQIRAWEPITPATHPALFSEELASGSLSGLSREYYSLPDAVHRDDDVSPQKPVYEEEHEIHCTADDERRVLRHSASPQRHPGTERSPHAYSSLRPSRVARRNEPAHSVMSSGP